MKVTLRGIIRRMERAMERVAQYSTLDSLVLKDLKRLEERIEGIQAEHTGRSIKSIGANWACGVNWACKEILGKEGDMK